MDPFESIKQTFFHESPATFLFSVFGAVYLVVMFGLAFIFGFIYRLALKYFGKNRAFGRPVNMNTTDRVLRAVIGVVLLVWAMTTTWSPVLLFFAGFTFFEAIFSWCAFNAAIGRNTCES